MKTEVKGKKVGEEKQEKRRKGEEEGEKNERERNGKEIKE